MNTLRLSNDDVVVEVLPDDGCDLYSIVDRATGIDVLWKAPWGPRAAASRPWSADSESHWMSRLSGGWQVLLPHAGPERTVEGAVRGFHGEAGVTAWNVDAATSSEARFSVALLTAPLAVRRTIALVERSVVLEETVTNESPDPTAFSWGHHPTFGAPLLAPGARIEIAAREQCDDGTSDWRAWPRAGGVDRSVVPAEPHAGLVYLRGIDEGVYRLINDRLGLGVELRWPLETFPHLWLWQELNASPGYPWFRRAYAMGLEPHTTVPAGGPPALTLAPGEQRTVRFTLQILGRGGLAR